MAIKVQGTTVIDDSKNISNIGVATVGILSANQITVDGTTGTSGVGVANYVLVSGGTSGDISWQPVTAVGSGTLDGINILEEGALVGTAGSVINVNFVGNNVTATGVALGLTATVTLSDTPTYDSLNVTGLSTFSDVVSIGATVGIGTRIDIVPYDTLSNGTLSFEGSQGQLFAITNNLSSGSIFSVNPISGIPIIDVHADRTIQLNPFGGNTGIGTTNPTAKLDVNGTLNVTGVSTFASNVDINAGLDVLGVSTFQGGIHDGTSLGTPGQVLSSTGTGLSWIDAAAGGGGGSGTFDTGITTSIYVSVTSGVGTNTAETNDIFVGPSIAYTFPSTSGKKYVIESIHITNTFNNELYFTARHDFNGGLNVPIAQRVIVPYQGATEFLDQPIIANPSDTFKFQALTGTGSTATGINGGLDAFITYSTKDDTDYIGTGKTVSTAAGTEIFQATSNPAMLQSIKLCNYSLNSDIDASISIYNGGLSSGVRQGYLAYNLTIPKNSVIEILEKPKYLATNAAIVAGASAANVLGVTLSGKYIT